MLAPQFTGEETEAQEIVVNSPRSMGHPSWEEVTLVLEPGLLISKPLFSFHCGATGFPQTFLDIAAHLCFALGLRDAQNVKENSKH